MLSVIVCGLLLCVGIMTAAQGTEIMRSAPNKEMNIRMFFYLCMAGMINNVCNSAIVVMKAGMVRDVLEAVAWCTGIAFMGITVYLLAFLLDTDEKKTMLYTSVIVYLGIIFYLVDILLQGSTEYVRTWKIGQTWEPIFNMVVMTILCLLYIYFIVSMMYSYRNRRNKKRERIIFRLITVVCVLTLAADVGEVMMYFMAEQVLPLRSLLMVVTAWCLKKAHLSHEALAIRREDYAEVLEANSHESVVICNDEGTVIFINKCAAIAVVEEKESVVGKLLTDMFILSGDGVQDFFSPHTGVFSIAGIYNATGRRCNLTVQNVYDAYGEIFTYIVTIYRLEYNNPVQGKEAAVENDGLQEQSVTEKAAVTEGAGVLLVDDSPASLKLLENLMSPFLMRLEKAYSGAEALQMLQAGNRYDMIFVDDTMPEMDGIETTKQIRAMEGEYFNQVPIVFCTATSIEENLTEFLKVRFNDFLTQPVSVKNVSDVLTRWLWKRVTETKTAVKEPDEKLQNVPIRLEIRGIDEKLAFQYIGDNETMYLTLLENFLSDMKDMVVDLEEYYTRYDRMRFRILTHAMKSACKGIGAIELSAEAERLEQACLNEDNSYIADNMQGYLTEFRELLKGIEACLNRQGKTLSRE